MSLVALAQKLTLGALLDEIRQRAETYALLDHWQQGEFHHDTVIQVDAERVGVPGAILVIATNCNGGVKEVLCFAEKPARAALWHHRCPNSSEFAGELPDLLGSTTTQHWFDPCSLLAPDARSELRPEFRERQSGGGWVMKGRSSAGSA